MLSTLGSHHYVVHYIESFLLPGNNILHIVMEYCQGGDLAEKIQIAKKVVLQKGLQHTDTHTET